MAAVSPSGPVLGSTPCSGKHKTRLLIGEGNFSFALALIAKHDNKAKHDPTRSLGHSIIATELRKEIRCDECDLPTGFSEFNISPKGLKGSSKPKQPVRCEKCASTVERIDKLKARGAIVSLGIDGTRLHEAAEFKDKKFTRIHWNCPHVEDGDFKTQKLPSVILDFFLSCAKVQDPGDKIHITLAQPSEKKEFYQGYYYNIVYAATLAGYVLVKKRKFDKKRYPGYEHVMTGTNRSALVVEQGMREFVFEQLAPEDFLKSYRVVKKEPRKLLLKKLTEKLREYSEKKYTVEEKEFYQEPRGYILCSSDEDSSDYDQ